MAEEKGSGAASGAVAAGEGEEEGAVAAGGSAGEEAAAGSRPAHWRGHRRRSAAVLLMLP